MNVRFFLGASLLASFVSFAEARAFNGVTEPIAQAVIGMTVPGRVDSIMVAEGAFVRKGMVILTLNKEEEQIQVQMTHLIAENQADLVSAQAKMDTYKKDYLATKKLFETSNSVSEEEVWKKELDYKLAKAEFEKIQMTEEKEKLEYQMALVQLEKRILRAPFDGEIVRITKNKSESIEALEPLVEIADVRFCRMTSYIYAPEARALKTGATVNLQLDGARTPRYKKGRVEFISPLVDKSSLLRTVKIIFDNTDGAIEPGVTGKVRLK